MVLYSLLIILSIVMAILAIKLPFSKLSPWVIVIVALMSAIAIVLFDSSSSDYLALGVFWHGLIVVADIVLLLYFFKEGRKFNSPKVWALALMQLGLLLYVKSVSSGGGIDIVLNELAAFMAVVISVVGGLIVIFALWYIDKENIDEGRKKSFIVMLSLFLAVMFAIVIANGLFVFFLLFELTTLASYLLIAFRQDDLSRANALKALWMNQIGGVFILLAIIAGNSSGVGPYFSAVISSVALF